MDRLQDHHLQWMARLDAVEEVDGYLLIHSDTTAYLDYGDSIAGGQRHRPRDPDPQ